MNYFFRNNAPHGTMAKIAIFSLLFFSIFSLSIPYVSAAVADTTSSCTPNSIILVSDTTNLTSSGAAAVATYNLDPRWTANIPGATWIWNSYLVADESTSTTETFTKTFSIPSSSSITSASLVVAADNFYTVSVNGTLIGGETINEENYFDQNKKTFNVAQYLHTGSNTISFTVTNRVMINLLNGVIDMSPADNPAGLLYKLDIENQNSNCGAIPTNTPPTITLVGANPFPLTVGQTFTDPGATAHDAEDGDLTSHVVATGTVNTAVVGTTTLTYSVTDSGGLSASTTRTVVVSPSVACTLSANDFETALNNGTIVANTILAGTSTASFTITNNTNCGAPISLSSYKVFISPPNSGWLSTQQFIDASSVRLEPHSSRTLIVRIATCTTQVDAWYGDMPPRTLFDNGSYTFPIVPFVITAIFANNGSLCSLPASVSDISVSKTVDNTTPHEGDTIHYAITVSNLGPDASTGVTATDTLPSGVTFVSATSSQGTYSNSTGTWTIGTLNPSTHATLQIVATVNVGTAGQKIVNSATATGSSGDSNLDNNEADATITVATNTTCDANTNLITNGSFENPTLASGFNWNVFPASTPGIGWNMEWLSPVTTFGGVSRPEPHMEIGLGSAYGIASFDGSQIAELDSDWQGPVNYIPSTPSSMGIFQNIQTIPGHQYTLSYAFAPRPGYDATQNILGVFENGTTLDTVSATGAVQNTTVWKTYSNTFTATSTQTRIEFKDLGIADSFGTLLDKVNLHCGPGSTAPNANLALTKTANKSTANVGDTVIYTITLVNNGPDTATAVNVSDTLPAGLNFVSASSSVGSYSTTTNIWTVGTLLNGSSTVLTLNTTIKTGTEGQKITNTAVATSTVPDSNLTDNTGSVDVTVNGCTSNCGGGGGGPSTGTVTFCLVIADSQNAIATSSSGLPSGSFLLNLATSTNIATSTIDSKTWTNSAFSPNRKAILSSANDSDCMSYNNLPFGSYYYSTVGVTGSAWNVAKYNDQFDTPVNSLSDFFNYSPELFNATSTDDASRNMNSDGLLVLDTMHTNQTLFVLEKFNPASTTPNANLAVTKTVDKSTPSVGDGIVYTITVVNNGPDNAHNVVVTDLLPAGVNFLSASSSIGSYATSTGIWNIGDLSNGSSTVLNLNTIVKAGTEGQKITNTAVATSTVPDSNLTDNTGSVDVTVNTPGGGGGGGGGGGCSSNCGGGGGGNGPIVGSIPTGGGGGPIVLGTSTPPLACDYLHDYLHRGWNNDPNEVRKLQVFLKDLEGFSTLDVTGVYDEPTIAATDVFQLRYVDDILIPWGDPVIKGSDFTYILTKKKVNEIYCQRAFPISPQEQSVIDAYRQFIQDLQNNNVHLTPATPEQLNPAPVTTGEIGLGNATSSNLAIGGPNSSTSIERLRNLAASIFSFPWNWMKGVFSPSQCMFGNSYCGWINLLLLLIIALMAYLWNKEYRGKKKAEVINKELDLK